MSDRVDQGRTKKIGLAIGWVLTLALAFALGHQVGEGGRATAMSGTASSSAGTPAAVAPDAEVAEILQRLPRRQPGDPLATGRVDAPVVLTEWSDYRCPYCARWATQTRPALERFVSDGTLRIEYRDMAVIGEPSVTLAMAARAAGEQGRFWEYYRAVFDAAGLGDQREVTTAQLVELAQTAGVPDLARLETDLGREDLREAVLADTQQAQQFGITGTPFFVIDTTVISGARPTAEFVAAIERAARDR